MKIRDKPSEYILNNYAPIPEAGCWIWLGGWDTKGYGRTSGRSSFVSTHRLFYQQFKGSIPAGMYVCHKCDTPACVNPDHLFLGTHEDNMRDMAKKGRATRDSTRNAKLTESQVISILQDPRKIREIAEDYGVNRHSIQRIKRGATWTSLTGIKSTDRNSVRDRLDRQRRDKRIIRDKGIMDARSRGSAIATIARKFQLTPQRIGQILKQHREEQA